MADGAANVGSFYGRSMQAADALELEWARQVEGVREEIALLRMELNDLREEGGSSEDFARVARAIATLVGLDYRISGRAGKGLSESLAALLEDFGELTATA